MTIIDHARRWAPLVVACAFGTTALYAMNAYAQAADDPGAAAAADPGDMGGGNAKSPLEESLLGAPQSYRKDAQSYGQALDDPQGISNAAQQAELMNEENIKAATPTDQILQNQAAGNARPQSFIAPGAAVLPNDPPVRGTDAKQVRTPDAAAVSVYRATPGAPGPKPGIRAGGVDPYGTTGHPIYSTPW